MENPFVKLFAIDFKDHLEVKKSGSTELKYVSWAYAWAEVKKLYPTASYEVKKFNGLPYVYDPITGFMVYTSVTIEGVSHEMWLPVLDGANKAMKAVPYTYTTPKWDYNPQTRRREKIGMEERTVEAASMFDVNKAIMRCLVKNLAMFGLGLYVYAGEDLPEDAAPQPESEPQKQPKPKSTSQKQEQPPVPCICARCNQPIKRVKLKDGSKLYRTAIGWRVVDANLASVLKVEGRKSPEREIFTDEQVTLILSQKNTPTGQMVIALLACGARIYELLHFKHEDFHRTESGAYLIGGCKTEAGRNRIIPILDFGIPVFEHAYATSVENGPLFPNGKGGFWNEKNWRNRKFYPFLEEIGIQPNPYDENGKRKPEFAGKLATYTPYTTRHTYASLCDRAGVNKDILKRAVGHTPKSKTLDEVYLHPKATQMIEAFDKANQLVNDEVLTTTKA